MDGIASSTILPLSRDWVTPVTMPKHSMIPGLNAYMGPQKTTATELGHAMCRVGAWFDRMVRWTLHRSPVNRFRPKGVRPKRS